jgi:hypothetical protein
VIEIDGNGLPLSNCVTHPLQQLVPHRIGQYVLDGMARTLIRRTGQQSLA